MNMTELTAAQIDYLAGQRLGRIATTGADRKPHVVPTRSATTRTWARST